MDLDEIRSEIDKIDDELVRLFCQRMHVAAQVADYWTQIARLASGEQTLSGAVRWPACLRGRDRLLRIGLHKRAGFKVENRFMRARLALFRRVMKHHVTLE